MFIRYYLLKVNFRYTVSDRLTSSSCQAIFSTTITPILPDGYFFLRTNIVKPKSVIRKFCFHFILKLNERCILC